MTLRRPLRATAEVKLGKSGKQCGCFCMAMSPLNPFNRFKFFYREIANPRMNGITANLPRFLRLRPAAMCELHSKWVRAISYNAPTVNRANMDGWQLHGMWDTHMALRQAA